MALAYGGVGHGIRVQGWRFWVRRSTACVASSSRTAPCPTTSCKANASVRMSPVQCRMNTGPAVQGPHSERQLCSTDRTAQREILHLCLCLSLCLCLRNVTQGNRRNGIEQTGCVDNCACNQLSSTRSSRPSLLARWMLAKTNQRPRERLMRY